MDPEEIKNFHPAIQSLLNRGIAIPPHLKNLFSAEKISSSGLDNNAGTHAVITQLDISPASSSTISPAAILPRKIPRK